MTKPLTAIDLFCGAGGLSEGFRWAGYSILAGSDYDEAAGETFTSSHGNALFIPASIESLSANRLLHLTGLKRGELTCLIGGPPCQAFSVYNHKRGMHDQRSTLFREYLRIVDGLLPEWVVMENVTGITSVGNGGAVKEIFVGLQELGYDVEVRTLKAEEYGVPQERRRVFFVANRKGLKFFWPDPKYGPGRRPYVTVWDAIGDLPELRNGEELSNKAPINSPQSEYQRFLRSESECFENHNAPKLGSINLERMKFIGEGGSWRDLPVELLPEGMKRARRSDHTKRYGRLRRDGLASTILTKCDLHWGAYIHPTQDRILTVREAARLQSFPDKIVFSGSRTEQYVQVGNAVPPLLGLEIGKAISYSDRIRYKKDCSEEMTDGLSVAQLDLAV